VTPGLPLATLAASLYGFNLLLGLATWRRWRGTQRLHGVHHALYGLSALATLLALGQAAWGLLPHALGLAVVALALALFPGARGGSRRHVGLALLGLGGHLVSFGLLC
jgi:hypothetical protein